ncbi:MAG TPA: hypothetical protein VF045_06285 [Acidimicrobiales bacterium]
MLKRLLVLSSVTVALTGVIGVPPASATHTALCLGSYFADRTPPGAGGGDYGFQVPPVTLPTTVVSSYVSAVSSAFAALEASEPAGTTVFRNVLCVLITP